MMQGRQSQNNNNNSKIMAISLTSFESSKRAGQCHALTCMCVCVFSPSPVLMLIFFSICIKFAKLLFMLLLLLVVVVVSAVFLVVVSAVYSCCCCCCCCLGLHFKWLHLLATFTCYASAATSAQTHMAQMLSK